MINNDQQCVLHVSITKIILQQWTTSSWSLNVKWHWQIVRIQTKSQHKSLSF